LANGCDRTLTVVVAAMPVVVGAEVVLVEPFQEHLGL